MQLSCDDFLPATRDLNVNVGGIIKVADDTKIAGVILMVLHSALDHLGNRTMYLRLLLAVQHHHLSKPSSNSMNWVSAGPCANWSCYLISRFQSPALLPLVVQLDTTPMPHLNLPKGPVIINGLQ